jgi:RNA polymerase sigma-70 factor (ECF subfamily)
MLYREATKNRSSVFYRFDSLSPTKGISLSQPQPVLPRIAAGDHSAVDECLQRYGGLVWSLARRRCPDIQLTEDAVQNIFLHLWKIADTFDQTIATETTFIAMVARRRLIDYQRKRMTRKDTAPCDGDCLDMKSVDPAARIEIAEEATRAENLLKQLPDDQQRVIRLSIYDGLSHAKIADQTGLKLGTVKTYIRRGLGRIRESLFSENTLSGLEKFDPPNRYALSQNHHVKTAGTMGGLNSN